MVRLFNFTTHTQTSNCVWAVIICQFEGQVRRVTETQFRTHRYLMPVAYNMNYFQKELFRGGYLCVLRPTITTEVKQCNWVLHGSFGVTGINCKSSIYATTSSNMLKGTYFHLSAQYKSCYVSQVTP